MGVSSGNVSLIIFVAVLAVLVFVAPSKKDFTQFISTYEPAVDAWLAWLREYRIQGMLLLGTIEICAVAMCIPPIGFSIELVAGSIFGLWQGIALISVAKCTAASITFLLGRSVLRSRVESWARSSPKFAALHSELEGWKWVVAMRVSPAPAFIANYGLALTSIPFRTYFVATFFATLAPITQNCLIGATATDLVATLLGRASTNVDSAAVYWAKKALLAAGVLSGVWVGTRVLTVLSSSPPAAKQRKPAASPAGGKAATAKGPRGASKSPVRSPASKSKSKSSARKGNARAGSPPVAARKPLSPSAAAAARLKPRSVSRSPKRRSLSG